MNFLWFFKKRKKSEQAIDGCGEQKIKNQIKIINIPIPIGYLRAGEKIMQELYEKEFGKNKL